MDGRLSLEAKEGYLVSINKKIVQCSYNKHFVMTDETPAIVYIMDHATMRYRSRVSDVHTQYDSAEAAQMFIKSVSNEDVADKLLDAKDGQPISLEIDNIVYWFCQKWNADLQRVEFLLKSIFNTDLNKLNNVYHYTDEMVIVVE